VIRTVRYLIAWTIRPAVRDSRHREVRAWGEGFLRGQQVMADHLAIHMHTTPEEDCDA
jgi:hypothetical protein